MKIHYILFFLLLISFSCSQKNAHQHPSGFVTRPNIIFILADDLGFADLSYTGSDLYETPHIDEFASQSMYFDHAYSAHPTCQPSRISLITGKSPTRLGAVSHGNLGGVTGGGVDLPLSEVTLGDALRSGGYTTAHIGKWHIGNSKNGPAERGFNIDIASNDFCCPASYFYPYRSNDFQSARDKMAAIPDLEEYDENWHLTQALSNEAVKFIAQNKDSEKPFFLNLWYYAVHAPIQAEREKIDRYQKKITEGTRHRNPSYAALVEHMDIGVGQVLKALEDNNLAENTIVIFMSDNGGALYSDITINYPLRGGKGMLYEGGTRVPLFVRWPGVTKPGSLSSERVIGWDIYPTVLSMAGVAGNAEHNKQMDGTDITILMRNPDGKLNERELHWLKYLSLTHYRPDVVEKNWPGGCIIKDDWKLIEFFEMPKAPKHHFRLFNLRKDPYEQNNLAEEMPQKVKELKLAMYNWRKKVNAPSYDMEKFYGPAQ